MGQTHQIRPIEINVPTSLSANTPFRSKGWSVSGSIVEQHLVRVPEQRSPSEIYRRALATMGHIMTANEAEALFLDEISRA